MQPILDTRLEGDSRVAAMIPACAVGRPALTIRSFTPRFMLDDLVTIDAIAAAVVTMLVDANATQQNALLAGGTGTGKTTGECCSIHGPTRRRPAT